MNCPHCGAKVAAGLTICPSCFEALEPEPAEEAPPAPIGPPFRPDEDEGAPDPYTQRLAAAKLRNALLDVAESRGTEGPPPGAQPRPTPSSPRAQRRMPSTPFHHSAGPSARPLLGCLVGLGVVLLVAGIAVTFTVSRQDERPSGPAPMAVPHEAQAEPVAPQPGVAEAPPEVERVPTGRLAYESAADGDYDIYLVDLPDGAPRNLTANETGDFSPSWSPDGQRIIFVSDRDGNRDVFEMDADGASVTPITRQPGKDDHPHWSPDGSLILFESDRDGDTEIYTMSPDGTALRQLTYNHVWDGRASWSPDGSQIVFDTRRDGDLEIYSMDADGRDQRNLSFSPHSQDHRPVWSPDGSWLAYYGDADGNMELYLMEPQGVKRTRLTKNAGDDIQPAWSPDSQWIAFVSVRGGIHGLYAIPPDPAEAAAAVPLGGALIDGGEPAWWGPPGP